MPDKPTNKKLTFIQWLAKEQIGGVGETRVAIKFYVKDALFDIGVHDGKCIGEKGECLLCELERMLSEYREYFKQNK